MKKTVYLSIAALIALATTGCNKKLSENVAANQQAISKMQYELTRQNEELEKLQKASSNDSIDGVAIKDVIVGQQYQLDQMNKQLTKTRKDLYNHLNASGATSDSAQADLNESGFATGSAVLTSKAKSDLDKLAQDLKQNPTWAATILGHTDNIGGDAVNKSLSKKRADAAKAYLVKKGIKANRITTKGLSNSKPVVCNDNAKLRAKNRRFEVVIKK